jgi:ATP-dependent DNA helicase PIF1
MLNKKTVFDAVVNAVTMPDAARNKHFFVDGPAGTGKTFLYNAIIGELRSQGKIVLVVASSGIAAYLLPGGRTAHSRFKIPVSASQESMCNISKQSELAELLRAANLIIWDEAVMSNKIVYEILDRSLQDVTGVRRLFGNIPVLFGGDFRQILPVVLKGNQAKTLQVTLKNSPIWTQLQKFNLTLNQRAQDDMEYSDFLLQIGEGTFPADQNGLINLPENIMCPGGTVEALIDVVFPRLNENIHDRDFIVNRVILTPKNEDADIINNKIAESIVGDAVEYFSADSVDDDNGNNLYPPEFLNTLTPSGMPPHHLILKTGIPIILLRNIDASRGLCNGTRLIVRTLQPHVIDAEIAVGRHRGTRVFIPRIALAPSETTLPF